MRKFYVFVLWCYLWIALSCTAYGQVIFSNIDSGATFSTGLTVSSTSHPHAQPFERAAQFTTPGTIADSFEVGSIDVAVRFWTGGANELDARLWTDSSGNPGTLLETISLDGLVENSLSIVNGQTMTGTVLSGATTYWLGLFTDGLESGFLWDRVEGASGISAYREPGDSWGTLNHGNGIGNMVGFQINAPNVIPEPSTYALIIGVGCLAFVVWRRSKQTGPDSNNELYL